MSVTVVISNLICLFDQSEMKRNPPALSRCTAWCSVLIMWSVHAVATIGYNCLKLLYNVACITFICMMLLTLKMAQINIAVQSKKMSQEFKFIDFEI